MNRSRRLWLVLLLLALLSPLGLHVPQLLRSGGAWGEWGLAEVRRMLGYVPVGMDRSAGVWGAPLPNYALPGSATTPAAASLAYILSAALGMAACATATYLLARWLMRRKP
jgi:cobalt/nickel transport protein